ncbi:hypothetical protein [Ectopseudomonas mendocina]|uniref:Uncharacterized protein n=1 Tax=Ectopseudomonas mendocina S5.2 TaxID=1225174 RepID=A0ABM5W3J0_ECTME|nr:hypothetical protein [Pseudomonas mendocina]ALN21783.1 hypothetical protein DW68_024200 [Pseudomonas mendocina S5.2]KER98160.1 hypothetical protein HN51_25525 [Pseudomonas mendocina]
MIDETRSGKVTSMAAFAQSKIAKAAGGQVVPVETLVDGFACPRSGVVFPTLYRVSYPSLDLPPGKSTPVFDGSFFSRFQLSAAELYTNSDFPGVPAARKEPFQVLSGDDQCWLEVFAFGCPQEASGFTRAALRLVPDPDLTMTVQGPSGYYGMLVRTDKPMLFGMITYHASALREIPSLGREVMCTFTTTVDRQGVVTQADPLAHLEES